MAIGTGDIGPMGGGAPRAAPGAPAGARSSAVAQSQQVLRERQDREVKRRILKNAGNYVAPTGTASRATFDTATVTTEQLAQRVKALIDDLMIGL